ncbi:MAG: apolipoprotein N-acyltransferase [Treponema sp.]|jgi:apolipoprotein N-acyltransferase|nr:apolipoprotein N-acyltransferase [Treponema sp.]
MPLGPVSKPRNDEALQVPSPKSQVPSLPFLRREWVPAAVWGLCLLAALGYGFFSVGRYDGGPGITIILAQNNTDPWKGALADYRRDFYTLRRLSDEALAGAGAEKPALVVWPETAFVPSVYWHSTYRDNPASWALVKELLDYLSANTVPFLIGNDDARKEVSESGKWERVSRNGVLFFERGKVTGRYHKMRLVPFSEHFPYRKRFPWVYDFLARSDTHFWQRGDTAVVFSARLPTSAGERDVRFSTPVCFEDGFGGISRDFTRNGADIIINLSNDAWSGSLAAQMQHLSVAVFRAVENRRSLARATASGQTCGIAPDGRIVAMAAPFCEAALTVTLPLRAETTVYTRAGDFFPLVCIGAALFLLTFSFGFGILKRTLWQDQT